MMGTDIFKIDASWTDKLTKTRVQFLLTPTVSSFHLSPSLAYPCLTIFSSFSPPTYNSFILCIMLLLNILLQLHGDKTLKIWGVVYLSSAKQHVVANFVHNFEQHKNFKVGNNIISKLYHTVKKLRSHHHVIIQSFSIQLAP